MYASQMYKELTLVKLSTTHRDYSQQKQMFSFFFFCNLVIYVEKTARLT